MDKSSPVAIVTGAGSGIGAAVASRLGTLGWSVVLVGRRVSRLEETAAVIEGDVLVVAADVADAATPDVVKRETLRRYGRIDALVNNAGIMPIERFEDVARETFDSVIATNLSGPYFMTQAVLPALVESAGSVVNLSSAAASMYRPGQSLYGSSKASLEYLTKSLAIELAPHGIRVNAVVPGPVDTPIHEQAGRSRESTLAVLERAVPLGRLGTVEEIAWWVATLTDPEAGWVTGAIIHVDGGRILAPPETPPL